MYRFMRPSLKVREPRTGKGAMTISSRPLIDGVRSMPFARRSLASVWMITFGLFALSAAGAFVAPAVLLLVVAGLAALAIWRTVRARPGRFDRMAPVEAHAVPASDLSDLIRMDSDKG